MKFRNVFGQLITNLKSKVYRKYLISYLAVFLIPVVVLMGINVMIYRTSLKDSVIKKEQDSIGNFKLIYDDVLSRANRIVNNISANGSITRALKKKDIMLNLEVQKVVDSVLVTDDVITDVFIYSEANQNIYGKASSISLRDFLYQEPDPTLKELVRDVFVSEKTAMRFVKAQNVHMEKGCIVYTVHRQNSDGTWYNVVFVINKDYIIGTMNYKGRIGAILEGDRLVIANSDAEQVAERLPQILSGAGQDRYVRYDFNGEKYTAYLEGSEEADIRYLMLIPEDAVIKRLSYINWSILLLLVIWGAAMIVILANMNYGPLKSLTRTTVEVLGASGGETDNLQFISDAIAEIGKQKTDLDQQSAQYVASLKKLQFMQSLMNGDPATENELELAGKLYRVFILKNLSQKGAYTDIADFTSFMENNILHDKDLLLGMSGEQTCMFLLCDDTGKAQDTADECYEMFCGQNRNQAAAGLGMEYGLEKIGYSYNEAAVAMEYSNVLGKIVFYENISHMDDITNYPITEISNIKNLLFSGRIEQANEEINKVVGGMLQNKRPIFLIKCVCYEIVSAIISEIDRFSVDKDNLAINLNKIMKIDNLDHLVQVVKNMTYLYRNAYQHQEEEKKNDFLMEIEEYIRAHFCDNDFSISRVADRFGISVANLGKQFKRYKNSNLSQYVTELQMERAKELLRNTEFPVSQIANMVGQQDVSNFIRKFKAREKITPGEYRKGG